MENNNEKPFAGKVVVVTGASAGLGRSIVREFAKAGADIGLLARGIEGLEGAKREVEAYGGKALIAPTDVSDPEQVEFAASRIVQELGPIDIWVNNAMISVFGPFKELDMKDFKRVTEVTYLGQVYGTQSALKRMLPRNKGSIILVGSALAYRGIPLQSAYCGAKHGIEGFFDSVRSELFHDKSKVSISMVQLPAMNTTQFSFVKSHLPNKPRPMGTIYQPEVAARAIVHVARHPQREMYVGYPTVQAILGNKLIPGLLDQYLGSIGYDGQQTNEPKEQDRPNNLYEPIPGDHGAHGSFDAQSWEFSPQTWAVTHKAITWGALASLALTIGLLVTRR
ncbi:MAG: SDR family oxidoreductase [Bacteroidetes bacterium]|nr:SDR family oxidoreductase [Bacteroidota bacterium]